MSPASPESRPLRRKIPWRRLEEEAVVLDVKKGVLYPLNAVGARVWDLCDGDRSADAIAETIVAEFDADPDAIRRDVRAFIADLAQAGLVTLESEGGRA